MSTILGCTFKDTITGFVGVATGHCFYLTGCSQVLLSPKVGEDGTLKEAHWFDEQRLERQGTYQRTLDNSQTPGFDRPAPKR